MDALIGITAPDWLRLLKENRFDIERQYAGRALQVSILSLMNSRLKRREDRIYGPVLRDTEVKPPVFILGHWRSGTTLVHEMLALDSQFAYPNLFQVTHPHSFLSREAEIVRALGDAPPQKRPMDNMEITFRSPGEDEGALAVSSLRSPVLSWTFPRREEFYDRYLSFKDASPQERQEFSSALLMFLKKLTWRYKKPVILKSPTHTARVKLLLELFPTARFIHVHRNPYVVYQSTVRLFEKAVEDAYLQRVDAAHRNAGILRRYKIMYDAFFEDRCLIPRGQYCEVRFEELERDLAGHIERIYGELNLPGIDKVIPDVRAYAAAQSGYKKNVHQPLSEEDRARVCATWQRSFVEWGYEQ